MYCKKRHPIYDRIGAHNSPCSRQLLSCTTQTSFAQRRPEPTSRAYTSRTRERRYCANRRTGRDECACANSPSVVDDDVLVSVPSMEITHILCQHARVRNRAVFSPYLYVVPVCVFTNTIVESIDLCARCKYTLEYPTQQSYVTCAHSGTVCTSSEMLARRFGVACINIAAQKRAIHEWDFSECVLLCC